MVVSPQNCPPIAACPHFSLQVLQPFEYPAFNTLDVAGLLGLTICLQAVILWQKPMFAQGTVLATALGIGVLAFLAILSLGFVVIIMQLARMHVFHLISNHTMSKFVHRRDSIMTEHSISSPRHHWYLPSLASHSLFSVSSVSVFLTFGAGCGSDVSEFGDES